MEIEEWLYTVEESASLAFENRDELVMMKNYAVVADLNYKTNQYNKFPTLLGLAEYGYQGENYELTANSDYLMASVVFRWNIFNGFQNNARIQQARIQKETVEKEYTEIKSKIELEVTQAWYDLQSSRKAIEASKKQSETVKKAFDIVRKKYNEGQANLIEFMDARTAMTNAEESLIINQYDYLIKKAELERVSSHN